MSKNYTPEKKFTDFENTLWTSLDLYDFISPESNS
jgi:hypothetical protein